MGWLEWSSAVISSTAWPVALVIVALIFRGQINKLLKRIKGAKYGDAEVQFRDELDKIEAQVGELPLPIELASGDAAPQASSSPTPTQQGGALSEQPSNDKPEFVRVASQSEKFDELAKLSPSAAVLTAWRDVECELKNSFTKSGLSNQEKAGSPFQIAIRLYKMGVIDRSTMDIINDLKDLRNTAAHIEDVSITDAYRFERLAREVIDRLQYALSR